MPYPDGALKGTFDNSTIITQVVPAVYGAALINPFTGKTLVMCSSLTTPPSLFLRPTLSACELGCP